MNEENKGWTALFDKLVRSLLLMTVLAFGLRAAGVLILHTYQFSTVKGPFSTTPAEFSFGCETGSIAASLAKGQGFSSPFGHPTGPTAWIAPIYPTLVAVAFKIFGTYSSNAGIAVLLLNSLLSALTCIPIVLMGRLTVGNAPALLAAWIWAVVPVYMKWPITWVWDMSLSGFLMAWLIYATLKIAQITTRKWWIAYGILWGIAALSNPALLSVLPLSLLWIGINQRRARQACLSRIFLVLLGFFICTTPWLVRNRVVFGRPVFFRDNFWFEFHLGNYHFSNGMGWGGKHPTENRIQLDFYTNVGELNYIDHYRNESMEFVRLYPREFLRLTVKRVMAFWDGEFFNYFYPRWWEKPAYVSVAALSILGLILVLGNRVTGGHVFGIVLLCYPLVYYVTYPGTRYRYAIEPEMLILVSYFLCELVRNFQQRFARRDTLYKEPTEPREAALV